MDSDRTLPPSFKWMVRGAAALMLLAGIIHLAIVPHHWEHAPAHGLFMGASGIIEILWAVLYYRNPSRRLTQAGILIAVALIFLWVITRIFPAPFGLGPEEIDLAGVATKLLETASVLVLAAVLVKLLHIYTPGVRVWQTVIPVVLMGVLLGMGTYEVARAMEPLFPNLAETQEHAPGEESPDHSHGSETPFA